jgi:hypothetical protein
MAWRERGIARAANRHAWSLAQDRVVVEAAQRYIRPTCELVLDLGCGWGHRMVDVWLNGAAPRARFAGGDRSTQSRDLVVALQGLFPAMPAEWFRFDFIDPNFEVVKGTPRDVCVLTCNAIEQVTYIGPTFFDRLLARYPGASITGIHVEPITFQIAECEGALPYVDIAIDRQYAEQRKYNMDLYPVVLAHPRLTVVAAEQAVLDAGQGNSTSVLVWRAEP